MITGKYRGKAGCGSWVYGSLIRDCDGTPMIHVAGYGAGGSGFEVRHSVEEKTIGEFTGLLDRNDREIYDKDVVRSVQRAGGILPPAAPATGMVGFDMMHGIVIKRKDKFDINLLDKENEVLGNVFDNPELITA